jgi:hypothetical protein
MKPQQRDLSFLIRGIGDYKRMIEGREVGVGAFDEIIQVALPLNPFSMSTGR